MLLDLFPLNAVLFPHQKIPLQIFEPRYLSLIENCRKENRAFGVCLIREGKEVGAPAIPNETGTSALIEEFSRAAGNLFHIVIKGEKRFKIKRIIQEQPHIQAEIEWIDNKPPQFPGDYSRLRSVIKLMVNGKFPIPDEENEFFGLVGALISFSIPEKQQIIELETDKVIPALTKYMESL